MKENDLINRYGYNPNIDYKRVFRLLEKATEYDNEKRRRQILKRVGGTILLMMFIMHQTKSKCGENEVFVLPVRTRDIT